MTENPEPAQRPRQLLSIASLATMFGVAPNTVHQWIKRGEDPNRPMTSRFPEADYAVPTHLNGKQEKFVLAWEPSREPELLAYKAQREARPGRNWRKGRTGSTRQPTFRHIGRPWPETHSEAGLFKPGTKVTFIDADADNPEPVGVVIKPTRNELNSGRDVHETDLYRCAFVEWPTERRWEYSEDLRKL